jgi:glycosyltransferase involved in cell wall biosynthesis
MSDPRMTIGVVIPFYGDDRWFPEALASVLAQTHPVDEVIVVDDRSPPGTSTALRDMPPPVRVIRLTRNQGPGHARALGTEELSTDLVTYIDADDRWPPDYLAAAVARLTAPDAPQAVYAAIAKQFPDGRMVAYDDKPESVDVREAIVKFHCYPALAMLFRRDALLAIGNWDRTRMAVEDWDLIVRFLDRWGPVPLVHGPLPVYRIGHAAGRLNSQIIGKLRRWRFTAWANRALLERHYGPGAHRRRFAQAVRDRADRAGGVLGIGLRAVTRALGGPLDQHVTAS